VDRALRARPSLAFARLQENHRTCVIPSRADRDRDTGGALTSQLEIALLMRPPMLDQELRSSYAQARDRVCDVWHISS